MEKVKFGITLDWGKGKHGSYAFAELDHFRDCVDDLEEPLRSNYRQLLTDLLERKVKRSTMVDRNALEALRDDLDNRCQIDYREDHWNDDPEITAGGKYFGELAAKLTKHLA